MLTPNHKKMWYYTTRGTTVGPVSFADFQVAANTGEISRTSDKAWCDTLVDWIPVNEIEGLFSSPPPPSRIDPESTIPSQRAGSGLRGITLTAAIFEFLRGGLGIYNYIKNWDRFSDYNREFLITQPIYILSSVFVGTFLLMIFNRQR